jgi:hypothetical protein
MVVLLLKWKYDNMKALIKATGEIKEVFLTTSDNWMVTYNSIDGCVYQPDDLQFQPEPFDIDWERRRWEASVAAMQGLLFSNPEQMQGNNGTPALPILVIEAIEYANALIEEYKNQQ